jgi:ubiquinone/menaquinone biosynthesis C-methylase UbiE
MEDHEGALPVNERAVQMIDMAEKYLGPIRAKAVDLGCGYGDITLGLHQRKVIGVGYLIDRDVAVARQKIRGYPSLICVQADIENLVYHAVELAICTSVLPYLKDPWRFMGEISRVTHRMLVECQYHGDGPGFADIESDRDMEKRLLTFYKQAHPVVRTHVQNRGAYRTLWLCE